MSDTPPERKEADDAPAVPKNPWVVWLVWVVLAPVLYVLSAGPVARLIQMDFIPDAVWLAYEPLHHLPNCVQDPIKTYVVWWVL